MKFDYPLFDADNHYYEPANCFVDWIDPKYRDQALHEEPQPDGSIELRFGKGQRYIGDGLGFAGARAVKPGALRERIRARQSAVPDEDTFTIPMDEAFLSRSARLARMDEQGIEATFLFPSFGVCFEEWLADDPDLLYAHLDAFNRWIDDTWGFDYQGRIFAPPMISLRDCGRAVAQLEHALERGARIIAMRAGPAYGRSPADPHFDPFWSRVNEAALTVAFHLGESGYLRRYSTDWGEDPHPKVLTRSSFQWSMFYNDRPISDTLAALILHNLFGRYPRIRVASIENGSLWVPYLLALLDKMKGMGRGGPWIGGYVKGRPSEIFKQYVRVSPYHEEDIGGLMDLLGPEGVLFGSDYPHSEGLANPVDFADAIRDRPVEDLRKVMRDNALELVRTR